jgi:hypothetical protein
MSVSAPPSATSRTMRGGTGILELPRLDLRNPFHQAYMGMRVLFTVAPILFGLDKFSHVLVNWDDYLAPSIAKILPVSTHTFMLTIGASV